MRVLALFVCCVLAACCYARRPLPPVELVINGFDPLFLTATDSLLLRVAARPGKLPDGTVLDPHAEERLQDFFNDANTVVEWRVERPDGSLLVSSTRHSYETLLLSGAMLPEALFEELPLQLTAVAELSVAGKLVSASAPVVLLDAAAVEAAAEGRVDGDGYAPVQTPEGHPVGQSMLCSAAELPVACVVAGRVVCAESAESCRVRTRAFAGFAELPVSVAPVVVQPGADGAVVGGGDAQRQEDMFVSTEFEVVLTERHMVRRGVLGVSIRRLQVLLPADLALGLSLHVKTRLPVARFDGVTASFFFVDLLLVDTQNGELVREFGEQRVEINLAVDSTVDAKDMQLGFFNPQFTWWRVADPVVDRIDPAAVLLPSGGAVQVVRTTTNHFTSFAVLVAGSADGDNGSSLDTMRIVIYALSGSLFLAVVIVSVIVIVAVYSIPSLRRRVLPRGSSRSTIRTLQTMRSERLSAEPDDRVVV